MTWSFSLKPVCVWKEDSIRDPEEKTGISKAGSQDLRIDLTEIEEENLIPISKSDEEHRYIRLLIQQPDSETSEDEIRKDCHDWMEHSQEIHNAGQLVNGKIKVIESMLAPVDIRVNGRKIKKGSWTMLLQVNDDKLLEDLRAGVFTVDGKNVKEI